MEYTLCWRAAPIKYKYTLVRTRATGDPIVIKATNRKPGDVHPVPARSEALTSHLGRVRELYAPLSLPVAPKRLNTQSAVPVHRLIFCSISIFLLASLVTVRRHQCRIVGNVLHHTYPLEYKIFSSQPRQKPCWASSLSI
jgi:hypothetical protein